MDENRYDMNESKLDSSAKTDEVKFLGEELVQKVLEKLMGQCLDMIRISEVSDRSCKQMERNIRQHFNNGRTYLIDMLKEKNLFNYEYDKK